MIEYHVDGRINDRLALIADGYQHGYLFFYVDHFFQHSRGVETFVKIFFAFYHLDAAAIVATHAYLMYGRKKVIFASELLLVLCDEEFRGGYAIAGVELLLCDLVLDGAEGGRFGIDLYAFGLQLFQGIFIDGFDLDGQGIQSFAKIVYIIEVPDVTFYKMMA